MRQNKPSRAKRLIFTAATIAIAVALLEGLSFVALATMAQQTDVVKSETHLVDAHRNHRLNPRFQLSGDIRGRLHAADGLRRSKVTSLTPAPDTIRIIVLGTSALYGIGARSPYPDHPPLANDETITYYLENLLQTRLDDERIEREVEVVNAGVSAYHTFHHLVYLNSDLLAYEPHVVVNFDGHNDFYADALHDRWNEYAYSTSILVDEYNGRSFYLSALVTTRALAPYSKFFNLAERIFRRTWYSKVDQPLPNTPRKAPVQLSSVEPDLAYVGRHSFVRDLWQIHQLGKYAGYQHCVFLQPEILLEDPNRLGESDSDLRRITVEQTTASRAERMQAIRQVLPELFAEYAIPFHDVGEIAPSNADGADLYVDYCHLTPAGAELTARRMVDPVYELVKAAIAEQK